VGTKDSRIPAKDAFPVLGVRKIIKRIEQSALAQGGEHSTISTHQKNASRFDPGQP